MLEMQHGFLTSDSRICYLCSNGIDILDEKVTRRFPLDDTYIPVDDPKLSVMNLPLEKSFMKFYHVMLKVLNTVKPMQDQIWIHK